MLGPDGTPLRRRYYSQESGRDLDDDEMIRGYEVGKGKYVVVTDEELERLAPEKTRDIALRQFVDKDSIPPFYFEHAYFLTPARGGSEKAYQLLAETMEKGNRAGIATFVMRGKEHLVAILAEKGILRAETLRFADELRSPADVGLPKKRRKIARSSVQRFEKIITSRTKSRLSPKAMADQRAKSLLKLVKKKHSRGKDVVETEESESQISNVVDIMDVLKRSLAAKRNER